jgi:hypothetical protein
MLAISLLSLYIVVEALYYQVLLGRDLERDLGFHDGADYIFPNGHMHSAVKVAALVPGGVFEHAGFRVGNVFPGLSHTGLFRLLHRHRGREAELTIVDGGPGPPFYERPTRVIRFAVPPREKR